jgi:hypothetical protein
VKQILQNVTLGIIWREILSAIWRNVVSHSSAANEEGSDMATLDDSFVKQVVDALLRGMSGPRQTR